MPRKVRGHGGRRHRETSSGIDSGGAASAPLVIEFYPEIRHVHVAAALVSGGTFTLRGLASLAGAGRTVETLLRILGYTADTTLLTAALMLMSIVHQYPFAQGWLTVKLVLLATYVTLGFIAFSARWTAKTRLGLWVTGLAVFGFIYSVALTRSPLGIFTIE